MDMTMLQCRQNAIRQGPRISKNKKAVDYRIEVVSEKVVN